ncbi:PaaI family thioesterase [Chelatococcus reniformis]|uniref:Thioesterase domain-containing protein n=1 Tax=Chelatococcus reniformis TaxID=1494448 RepID=A0A916XQ82_9HYPH|nr:PaaI family thioesterase [Chelatococcus reniformis]GGC91792.1 hypothetical protein GCM10010994_56970 [Chelatococcus reniformis]
MSLKNEPYALAVEIVEEAAPDGLGWSVRDGGGVLARFQSEALARACVDQLESAELAAASRPPGDGWEEIQTRGFTRHTGPMWFRVTDEGPVFGFVALPKHRNRRGIIHGGMLMTFADRVLGMHIAMVGDDSPHATIHLDTHFISSVKVGEFVEARCEIVRRTRSMVFVAATLTVGDRVIARAQGIWKLL